MRSTTKIKASEHYNKYIVRYTSNRIEYYKKHDIFAVMLALIEKGINVNTEVTKIECIARGGIKYE